MRSREPVFYVVAVVVFVLVCLGMVCQVRSCARKIGVGPIGQIGRIGQALTGAGCLQAPESGQTEPQPSIVPPGHSALPSASRRQMFGKAGDEGTEVEVRTPNAERRTEDTVRLRIRKDGAVQNVGKDTVVMTVRRYGPAWVEWDPSVGVCAMGRTGDAETRGRGDAEWGVVNWRGWAIGFGVKGKVIDFRPGRVVQVGIPVIYATTAGPGIGVDFRLTGTEWAAIDIAWMPMVRSAGIGVSVNIP